MASGNGFFAKASDMEGAQGEKGEVFVSLCFSHRTVNTSVKGTCLEPTPHLDMDAGGEKGLPQR